jgi:serpin B
MLTTASARPDFAVRLYDKLASTQAGQNLFLSPFSIQVALAMCAAGARGETRKAIGELIGAPHSLDEQNRQYAEWIRSVGGQGQRHIHLAIANALWRQQGLRLQPDYQKTVADFYDGACNEVDFLSMPDQAVQTINAWVETRTAGTIRDLIGRDLIGRDTRLILTNAIYFKGKWDREFDPRDTQDEDWHGPRGVRKVPMMQQRQGCLYYENDDFQALDLTYQGQQLSMLIVLPRKTDSLPALEKQWAAANTYQRVTSSLRHEETVIISLPRFKLATQVRLSPVLSDMGTAVVFSEKADFSGIALEPLKLSEVIHKAFIEVNEEGTEAAAATGVSWVKAAAAAPKCFLADHPFLFLIRDRKSGSVLFSGRVLEPGS